jgi:hypothetical protein
MQTVQIPNTSANDATHRVICPEGCAVWVGKAARPWWIYTGGIGTCVACVIYEFNSPAPQIYFYHFIASGAALLNDFTNNLPPRLAGSPGLFRVRLYSNPNSRSQNSLNRIQAVGNVLAGVNQITNVDTAGGFNVRFSNGTFTDGVAGGQGIGRLFNLGDNRGAVVQFCCMKELGGAEVNKTLPGGW